MEFSKLKLGGATVVPLNSPVDIISESYSHGRDDDVLTIRFVEEVSPSSLISEFLWGRA